MVSEEIERPSDMPRAHGKAKVPNVCVHGPSLMGVDTVNRKRQKSCCGGRLYHHSLEEQQGPNLSQETGDKVQGRLTEQTEVHE